MKKQNSQFQENPEMISKDYLSLLVLVGLVKTADHIAKEMFGL